MKIIFSLLLFFLSLGSVFATAKETDELYGKYTNNIANLCASGAVGWSGWTTASFVKVEPVEYASINRQEDGDKIYKKYLKTIGSDDSKIDDFWANPSTRMTPAFLKKASYVYKETMNTIYTCAVITVRIRTINMILKTKSTNNNLKKSLEDELKNANDAIGQKGCLPINDTSELSIKNPLLDYTTYQYCNYRYYLDYLDNASQNSIIAFFSGSTKTADGTTPVQDTSTVNQQIMGSKNEITTEIAHTKEIFPQAMAAFSEFEKTYAAHIILQFILQDYIEMRSTLKSLLNPIGQVIYKASNAQAP